MAYSKIRQPKLSDVIEQQLEFLILEGTPNELITTKEGVLTIMKRGFLQSEAIQQRKKWKFAHF